MIKLTPTRQLLLAVCLSLAALTAPAYAESVTPSPIQSILSAFSSAFEPPEEDAPRRTLPAGSRDEARCSGDSVPMRPLIPEANYGLTTEEHPVLWMEVPSTRAQEVLLVFQTEAGDDHARVQLPIPGTIDQGVVPFQLPENLEGLKAGQNYRWTLSILCEGYLSPYDPIFSGWIKHEVPALAMTQTLANTTVVEQVEIFKETGYWYDMVTLILNNQETFRNSEI